MSSEYSARELVHLLFEFNKGTPISQIEKILGRSGWRIIRKMQALSKQDPDIWNSKKIGEYVREQKRQWYHQWYPQHREEERERKNDGIMREGEENNEISCISNIKANGKNLEII